MTKTPLGSEEGSRGADDLSYSSPKAMKRQRNLRWPPHPHPPTFAGLSSPSPFVNLLSMSDFLPLAWRERKTKIALLIVAFWAEVKKKH